MNEPEDSAKPPADPRKDIPDGEWDSDEALDFLKMERDVHGETSNLEMTKRLLEESAPMAAMSIINLARNSTNDNTRLAASRYIVDHIVESTDGAGETWESFIGDVIDTAEQFANAGASNTPNAGGE